VLAVVQLRCYIVPYHSEYGQDRWLNESVFKGMRNGIFVEFGALDGILHSNTLFFESELGWGGLCIEANPALRARLPANRPNALCLSAAIYDRHGAVLFERIDGGLYGWSGIKDTIEQEHWDRIQEHIAGELRATVEVPCVPLDYALEIAGLTDIDYMSIDVEGAEYKILSAFPFEKYTIRVFGVEDNFGNTDLDGLMARNHYMKVARIGPDNVYIDTRSV
jgi:FkbM family methyltransferase